MRGTLGILALIYLFEDDPALRSLLLEMLQGELAADVESFAAMSELRRRCLEQRPDLIVADFWGASHLKLDEVERAEITELASVAPLVLVSARSWGLDVDVEELGLAAFVAKPLDAERFTALVQEALAASTGELDLEDQVVKELPGRDTLSVFVLSWPGG